HLIDHVLRGVLVAVGAVEPASAADAVDGAETGDEHGAGL
ncbi:MAG: hypothetical protein QOG45_263, partial [Chloroflexota bacterium]|nr:hypothetical protein [Chloroflexota bacterium]